MWLTPAEWQIVRFTLAVCALSTVIILPLGLAVAWPLARHRWPGKLLVETLVTLPLVLPPVATGLLLLKLFSRRGGVGQFLHEHLGIDVVFTWRAVVAAAAVMSFPLLVRSARVGFQSVNQRLEQIARTLGASDRASFLPLRFRSLRAASLPGSCSLLPARSANLAQRLSSRETFREELQRFHWRYLKLCSSDMTPALIDSSSFLSSSLSVLSG